MTDTRKPIAAIIDGISALVVFGLVGCGIGYFQAMIAFRSMDASIWGCTVGVPAAVVIGGILWFIPLHRHLSFSLFGKVVTSVLGSGLASAFLLNAVSKGELGWLSVFVSPAALVISAIAFRDKKAGAPGF